MNAIRSRLLLATTMASLVLTTAVHAQGGANAPRPRDGQGQAGTMRRGGPGAGPGAAVGRRPLDGGPGSPAAMMLRLRTQLQLTDEQVKRLEALQNAPAPRAHEADLLRARADLLEATQGDGNLAKARTALDRMSALRNERMVAGLRQRQEARAVLTADQKTRLDNMRTQLRTQSRARGVARGVRGGRDGMRRGRGVGPANVRGRFGPGGNPEAPAPATLPER